MAENRKIISRQGYVRTGGIEETNGIKKFGIICASVSGGIGIFLLLGYFTGSEISRIANAWMLTLSISLIIAGISILIACLIASAFIDRLNVIISLLKNSEYMISDENGGSGTPAAGIDRSQSSLLSRLSGDADSSQSNEKWSCKQCGYVNLATSRECTSCGRPR